MMFNLQEIEERIKQSDWWQRASNTVDSHYCNASGIMLTHHLQVVNENVDIIFKQPETGFYGSLFSLMQQLKLDKEIMENEGLDEDSAVDLEDDL